MTSRVVLLRILAIWAFAWPLVTLGLWALQAGAPSLPTPIKTLILTAFLVPAISLVIGPFVARVITGRPSSD